MSAAGRWVACRLRGCPGHDVGRNVVMRQLLHSDRLLLQVLTVEMATFAAAMCIVVERHRGEYSRQVGGM